LAGEFEWRCCGDGEIMYVVPAEKVANLMFIQHSNTLILFTNTQIHSHTLTYTHILSKTLKYTQIHSNTIITITFTHIHS